MNFVQFSISTIDFFKKVIQSGQGLPGNRPLPQWMLTSGWRYQQVIGPDLQAYRRENPVFS
jgi:hypothetical protein